MTRQTLCTTFLLAAMTAGVLAQESGKTRKFLKKPLVIEDQGSFFIGGVPKVTPYATVPGPNAPATAANAPDSINASIFQSPMNDQSGCVKVAGRFFSMKKCPVHARP